jgi:hypothetical protein
MDMPLCGANDQQMLVHVFLDVHGVHALAAIKSSDGVCGGEIPHLYCLVPGACDEVVCAVGIEPGYGFYGFVVGFGFLGWKFTPWGVAA